MQYRFDTPQADKNKKTKRKTKYKRQRKNRPALKALLYVLAVGFLTSLFIGGYVLFSSAQFVGGERALVLEDYKLSQAKTTIIYAYQNHEKKKKPVEIARLHGEENRIWVPLATIPENLQNAFIALEDKRFWEHKGVDWVRTIGSVTKYKMSQGGSTLTQQLIKNLTNEKEVTIVRKVWEILSALNLEKYYSKNDIFETYMNTLYMGNGCYGVQTAAETYFGKNVQDLSLAECAVLAIITKAPTYYDPLRNPENVKTRQEDCLYFMHEQGYITDKEYEKALKKKLVYTNSKSYKPSQSTTTVSTTNDEVTSSFVDYVIEDVITGLMNEHGYGREQATKAIYYNGLKIYTTMDIKAQNAAEEVFLEKKSLPADDVRQGVQASMTMMDYQGRVVAMVGQLGKKTGSRSLNRATQKSRQPGSTFKPLAIYSVAIEKNLIYWSKLYNDSPSLTVDGKRWPPNYSGSSSGKNVTVQYALRQSLNTIPVRIGTELGTQQSFDWVTNNLHISTLNPEIDKYSISAMALGGGNGGVSTLEMCAAYATIGNLGKYYKPYSYYKVVQNKDGEDVVLLTGGAEPEQAMKPETAELTRRILETIPRGEYNLNSSTSRFPSFMKTGTSNEHKDRWFALGFPSHVMVMWYGYDKPKMTNYHAAANPAGILGFDTFKKISADLPDAKFENSGNLVQKAYCTQTGLIASSSCKNKASGWYVKSNIPMTCSSCKGSRIKNND